MAKHSPLRRRFDRLIGYRLEAVAVFLFVGLMSLLPVSVASGAVGGLLRRVGPLLATSRKALRNIARSFPDLDTAAHRRILADSWDNFGRTVAEYIHLKTLARDFDRHVEVTGAEHLTTLLQAGRAGVIMTGHFGNWELVAMTCARLGIELTFVYRAPNNPYVDRRLAEARGPLGGRMVPKGRQAARELVATARRGGHIGLLIDQKLNEGIPVPFLGRDAMTGTVLADMALRYGTPIIPMRVIRLAGTRFRVEILPPLQFQGTGEHRQDTAALMLTANQMLEGWVREYPGQWLWQHRRWPD
jgi:Kdo2-lipid IVA lauroyltransferase/acyltransferase